MMLVHPRTVVLNIFGPGKTQIAVKMSGALTTIMPCMRGSRNFHERGSNENGNFWSQVKFSNSRGDPHPRPPPPSGSVHAMAVRGRYSRGLL